jgi:integration host factor subunit beta
MNKSELIEALAQEIDIPHREAAAITNTVLDAMTEALVRGESIEIRGFGSFVVKEYGSYEGRNRKPVRKSRSAPKSFPFSRWARIFAKGQQRGLLEPPLLTRAENSAQSPGAVQENVQPVIFPTRS